MAQVEHIEYPTREALFNALPEIHSGQGVVLVEVLGLGKTLRVTREDGSQVNDETEDDAENSTQIASETLEGDESDSDASESDEDEDEDEDLLGDATSDETVDLEKLNRAELSAFIAEHSLAVDVDGKTPLKFIRDAITAALDIQEN